MPINALPDRSAIAEEDARTKAMMAPASWVEFFRSTFYALFGWRRTYTGTLTHDFGSISGQSQATTTLTLTGVRVGDAVIVRPNTAVNGIILDGTVTANDTVTIRAVNYTGSGIDPDSQTYRVLVFQQ